MPSGGNAIRVIVLVIGIGVATYFGLRTIERVMELRTPVALPVLPAAECIPLECENLSPNCEWQNPIFDADNCPVNCGIAICAPPPAPAPPTPPQEPPPAPVPPPLEDIMPPSLSLNILGKDSLVTGSYAASDTENAPVGITLLAGFSESTLAELSLIGETNSFDHPPLGAIPLSVSPAPKNYSVAGYLIQVSANNSITIGGLKNGQTIYFRMRACDSAPQKNCAATNVVSATPILEKVTASVGAPETVFDWSADRCEDLDLPDTTASAVRTVDGALNLFAGNQKNYRMVGTNFNDLIRDCSTQTLASSDIWTPSSFNNREWVWSAYRVGSTIHALIHNEYHDPHAPNCKPGDTSPANPCTYNSITHAQSNDHGVSFTQNTANAAHVIAALPKPWESYLPESGTPNAIGYMNPTNIVRHADGYYYSIFDADTSTTQNIGAPGICLMRTNTLADPKSWRAWNGTSFSLTMRPPYSYPDGAPQDTGMPVCAALTPTITTGMGAGSLTYNTHIGKYMLVSYAKFAPNGAITCGFYASFSSDLIHWSEPQLLFPTLTFGSQCPNQPTGEYLSFPSIIDHSEWDANFEKADATAYLYYMKLNESPDYLDRDLVRRPITFTKE